MVTGASLCDLDPGRIRFLFLASGSLPSHLGASLGFSTKEGGIFCLAYLKAPLYRYLALRVPEMALITCTLALQLQYLVHA
jgi:hypothetical protein